MSNFNNKFNIGAPTYTPPPSNPPSNTQFHVHDIAGGGNKHGMAIGSQVGVSHRFNDSTTGFVTGAGTVTRNHHTGNTQGHFNGASVGLKFDF